MGQEKHRALTQAFYKNALGVFLVFDVTQRNSFSSLDYYYQEIHNNSPKDTKIILLGNKIDLTEHRQVNENEARVWAQSKGVEYFEVSAKNNTG